MMKISVIVPVYMVEKYLAQCIDSIVGQTHQNLEIILVDDGSPDGCGAICDAWKEKDARVRVIHTENKGLASARNTGLAHATGAYIMFVDSDDYIVPQMAARLLQQIERDQSDVAVCDCFILHETTEQKKKALPRCAAFDACLDKNQALHLLGAWRTIYGEVAWNKLYAKKLFEHICFPDGKIHEDVFILHRIYAASTRISFLSDKLYCYRHREDSITTRRFTVHRLDAAEGFYQRAEFMKAREDYDLSIDAICRVQKILRGAHSRLDKNDTQARERIKRYDTKCKQLFFACFWKKMKWTSRGAALLHIIHPNLYHVVEYVMKTIWLYYVRLRTIGKSTEKETL